MAKDTEKLIRQLSPISFLMAERRPVSALEIRQDVEGYAQMTSDEAFNRRFYADRAELSSLGIDLKVEKSSEGSYEAETYTLPPENFYLPAIEFSDTELGGLRTALTLLDGEFAYAEPLRLALQQEQHQLLQAALRDPGRCQRQQFIEHLLAVEPRRGAAQGRVEPVGGVGIHRFADLADFQLGAEGGLAIDGSELVEAAWAPLIPAIGGQRRIGPDRECHLAPSVAKSDPEVGLPVARCQRFLERHEHKQIALRAGRHFAQSHHGNCGWAHHGRGTSGPGRERGDAG